VELTCLRNVVKGKPCVVRCPEDVSICDFSVDAVKVFAAAVGSDLIYEPIPTWTCYQRLNEIAINVRQRLLDAGMNPRHGICRALCIEHGMRQGRSDFDTH
jgi:hypothetical protein